MKTRSIPSDKLDTFEDEKKLKTKKPKNRKKIQKNVRKINILDIYIFCLEINNSKNTLYMASLDVGGFCFGIKKSNYLPKDFSHTTTITQRMQIPKKPQILFDFPYYTVKQFYYKLSLFSTKMLKTLVQGMEDRLRQEENFQHINQTINLKKASNVSNILTSNILTSQELKKHA